MNSTDKRIIIVGGGPAGLMAATQLLDSRCEILLIDQKATVGRKFLVAGEGGFNLTHSEPLESFVNRYDCDWIKQAVKRYDSTSFRDFLEKIGVPTIIGSSGKVFPPDDMKPAEVLKAWKKHLSKQVTFSTNTQLLDFSHETITIQRNNVTEDLSFDFLIFALGGGSWKKTGSDGEWKTLFETKNINVAPFQSSNSGVLLDENWLNELDGKLLKNCIVSCGEYSCPGDILCTSYGLEGKPIYAVNQGLRKQEKPIFTIDFKPQFNQNKIVEILRKEKNPSQGLKELKLAEAAIFWLKTFVSKKLFTNPQELGKLIKCFPIEIKGFRPLDEVISTAGGVSTTELSENGELLKFQNLFCAGEMIEWDAPTGGYLIQGCVSTGFVAGNEIKNRLKKLVPISKSNV